MGHEPQDHLTMNPVSLGLIRHLLTLGAGFLASRGVINASETEVVVGTGIGIIGVIWSIIDKKRTEKKLRAVPVED
jgi:hypothetical protein